MAAADATGSRQHVGETDRKTHRDTHTDTHAHTHGGQERKPKTKHNTESSVPFRNGKRVVAVQNNENSTVTDGERAHVGRQRALDRQQALSDCVAATSKMAGKKLRPGCAGLLHGSTPQSSV